MWMNTTFRGFKTGRYAMRYTAKCQYRFNRRFDLAELMPTLLASCTSSVRPLKRPSEPPCRLSLVRNQEGFTPCFTLSREKDERVSSYFAINP